MRLRPRLVALILTAASVGCGDDDVSERGAEKTADLALASRGAVVATVGGQPIDADCVAAHVERESISRQEALEACIEFELLAQEAARRGYGGEEAAEVRTNEAVRRLIDETFYAKFASPADVEVATVRRLWDSGLKNFYNRTENRTTYYCRAGNPDKKGMTPEGEPARAAKTVADAIYAEAKSRARNSPSGLSQNELKAVCTEVAARVGGAEASVGRFVTTLRGRAVIPFADAAFAIKEVGDISPPTRTTWGWDIILLLDVLPAATHTFEEALPLIQKNMFEDPEFEPYRRQRFSQYLQAMMAGVEIERFDAPLELLDPPTSPPTAPPMPAGTNEKAPTP